MISTGRFYIQLESIIWGSNLGESADNLGQPFGAAFRPALRLSNWGDNLGQQLGKPFGATNWGSNLGQQFGAVIWGGMWGQQFWAAIRGSNLVAALGREKKGGLATDI